MLWAYQTFRLCWDWDLRNQIHPILRVGTSWKIKLKEGYTPRGHLRKLAFLSHTPTSRIATIYEKTIMIQVGKRWDTERVNLTIFVAHRSGKPTGYVQLQWETCQATREDCLVDPTDPAWNASTNQCKSSGISEYYV